MTNRSAMRAFLAAAMFASAVPLAAQVAAHQGNAASEDPKQFASPMILDIPLRGLTLLSVDRAMSFNDVQGYFCEDATIKSLKLTRLSDHSGQVRLELVADVFVRKSYDRYLTLNFNMLAGDTSAGTANSNRREVPEKAARSFRAVVEMTAGQFAQLSASSKPLLRVTVIVASAK